MSEKNGVLLDVSVLVKHFPTGGDWFTQMFDRRKVKAVDGVDFSVTGGTTLGLVGESGSGKTTTGRLIAQLTRPTSGRIHYDGIDLGSLRAQELRGMRKRIQMIFQDPSSSLNRRKTAGQIVSEPIRIHHLADKKNLEERLVTAMEHAGLSRRFLNRYPHEMSGGQRQRVGIARALAVNPEFIICDEPVTALDVSIQAQILNLLMDLQDEFGLTYLFIAHDLSVVRHVSDRVAVMYLGKIVEVAHFQTLFAYPKHPYTKALLAAVPKADPTAPKRKVLHGEVPSPIHPPSGCSFHPRCPEILGGVCREQEPRPTVCDDGTRVCCHHFPTDSGTTRFRQGAS